MTKFIPYTIILPLFGYLILTIILFLTQNYNDKTLSYNVKQPVRSIGGLLYSILSIGFIVLFILNIPNLTLICNEIGKELFGNPPKDATKLDEYNNAVKNLIKIPMIILLTGFIGNYTRAFYTLNELDHGKFNLASFGNHFTKNRNKRAEGFFRFLIMILFILIGNLISSDITNGRLSLFFIKTIPITLQNFFIVLAFFTTSMYIFLIVWVFINFKHFVNDEKDTNGKWNLGWMLGFYVAALILSIWFFAIGFNWFGSVNVFSKQIYYSIISFVAMGCGLYMLVFVIRDLFYIKRKAFMKNQYHVKLKKLWTQ